MARRFLRGGLSASLALEGEDVQVPDEPSAADGGAESLETDLLEVQDSEAEGAAREGVIEDAVEVADELEKDAEEVAVATENGGLDQYAASILMRKANNDLARIGMSPIRFAALESFGSISDRRAASKIAMESLRDKAKQVWDAIVKALKKAYNWLKGHVLKVFGGLESLVKRSKALSERASNTSGKLDSDGRTFENDRVFNGLAVAGKVTSFSSDAQNTFGIYKTILENVAGQKGTADNLIEMVDEMSDSGTRAQARTKFADTMKEFINGGLLDKVTVTDPKVAPENTYGTPENNKQSAELLGGKVILTYIDEAKPEKNKVRFGQFNPKATSKEGVALKTLTPSEAEAVADLINEVASIGMRNRPAMDKLLDSKGKLVKKAEKLANSNEAADRTEKDENRRTRDAVMALDKLIGTFPANALSVFITTAKNALDYAELSLKQYKKS